MDRKIQKLIYKSFDAELSADEKKQLEQATQESDKVQKQLQEMEMLRSAAADLSASFKPNFAERVVKAIAATRAQAQEDLFAAMNYMFRRIAIAGALAVIILLSVTLLQSNHSATIYDYAQSQTTLDEIIVPSVAASLEELL